MGATRQISGKRVVGTVPAEASRYALHGLCVESEIPLQERLCERPADVCIRWGETGDLPAEAPLGQVLAGVDRAAAWYWLVDTGDGYTIRVAGLYEFRVSRDRRIVIVHRAKDADPDLAPIFLSGIVLALLVSLAGRCVLHASAVQVEGVTVALAGGSGTGKSTVTALLCSGSATLISDDLLRIDVDRGNIVCFEGTSQIRLRASAAELACLFPAQASSLTADERIAVSVECASGSPFSLDAVVLPKPSRTASRLTVTRLTPYEALVELLRYPRVVGWHLPDPIRTFFRVAGEVSLRVPVHVAEIPWGPPFGPETASALLRETGIQPAR